MNQNVYTNPFPHSDSSLGCCGLSSLRFSLMYSAYTSFSLSIFILMTSLSQTHLLLARVEWVYRKIRPPPWNILKPRRFSFLAARRQASLDLGAPNLIGIDGVARHSRKGNGTWWFGIGEFALQLAHNMLVLLAFLGQDKVVGQCLGPVQKARAVLFGLRGRRGNARGRIRGVVLFVQNTKERDVNDVNDVSPELYTHI